MMEHVLVHKFSTLLHKVYPILMSIASGSQRA